MSDTAKVVLVAMLFILAGVIMAVLDEPTAMMDMSVKASTK